MNSNNPWHALVIDGVERNGDGVGGVTTLVFGKIFNGRREFRSVEEARAHVRELVKNDNGRLFRYVVDLPAGESFAFVDYLSIMKQTYLDRCPGAWD